MRSPFGIKSGVSRWHELMRSGAAPIITATVQPSLAALEDGDTIASALSADIGETSNYASSEGTISTVVVAITVDGSPALSTDTVNAGEVVSVTVTVTDSEANERVFNAGTRTVAAVVPAAFGVEDWTLENAA